MAANYDDVLRQLRDGGLLVDHIEVGRLRRCKVEDDKERRGWYLLHELRTADGDILLVGSYGVWHGTDNGARKIELEKSRELTGEQKEALRKRLREDKLAAERARQAEADKAARRAGKLWAQLSPDGDCDYLAKKGVQAHGVRFTAKGSLVIPLQDTAGRIHGLQIIRNSVEAKKSGALSKEFWPKGLAKKGTFFLIGVPNRVILIAEGYATAASLHEATGLPVAVAWDAGNVGPVCVALKKHYRQSRQLICADDDQFAHCRSCRGRVLLRADPKICPHCGALHMGVNAGLDAASAAALESGGAWIKPVFDDAEAREAKFVERGLKLTDFNDLHSVEGLAAVRAQVEARLTELRWAGVDKGPTLHSRGGGAEPLRPIATVEQLLERFSLVYGMGGVVFDAQEHLLVALSDMRDACMSREVARAWQEHPERGLVRKEQVGFDPTEKDANIVCNLWSGWPTSPRKGNCDRLLDLLRYMCSNDERPDELYRWVLSWLAYPLQHPGAKMKTCLVLHGPQGTGKNMFFEVVMAIYGCYGRIIDQSAVEDKFNDWSSRKLFLIADEVVARSDLYHVKNRLKAFIDGEWIRINPKNMAAYDERNHVNMVFLSNEVMPVVLEEDDRRHTVIHTPVKLDQDFYKALLAEIADGGAGALYDYLLHWQLGDFTRGTLPPHTKAKSELIDQSRDSTSRFYTELMAGDVLGSFKLGVALSTDVYELYRAWCARKGLRQAPEPRLIGVLKMKHGVVAQRKRWRPPTKEDGAPEEARGPHGCLVLGDAEQGLNEAEADWLGKQFMAFRHAANDYKGASHG